MQEKVKKSDNSDQLKAESMFDFKYISGLTASPGHKRAIFKLSQGNLDENEYSSTLWMLNSDGKYYKISDFTNDSAAFFESDDSILINGVRDKTDQKYRKKELQFSSFYRLNLERPGEAEKAFTLPLNVSSIVKLALPGIYLVLAGIDLRSPKLWELDFEAQEKALQAKKDNAFREHIKEIPFYFNGAGMIHDQRQSLFLYDEKNNKLRPMLPESFSLDSLNISEDHKRLYIMCEEFKDKRNLFNRLFYYELPETLEAFEEEPVNLWPRLKCLYTKSDYDFYDCYESSQGLRVIANDHKKYGVNQSASLYALEVDGKNANPESAAAAAEGYGEISLRKLNDLELHMGNAVGTDCRLGGSSTFDIIDGEAYYVTTRLSGTSLRKIRLDGSFESLFESLFSIDGFVRLEEKFFFVGMFRQSLQEIYAVQIDEGKDVNFENDLSCPENLRDLDYATYEGHKKYCEAISAEMSKLQQLTTFNAKALKNKYVASPIPIISQSLKNADGDDCESCDNKAKCPEIEGYVLLPEDYHKNASGKVFPMILDIHGGPRTVYGRIYYHEMQYWVNKGFVVAFCNPRGSDGRGDEFADIRGLYGDVDYDDIMAFVDKVLQRYDRIDVSRIGVTGGSYGGYMTNRIITRTNRFTAAATQRSITNWLSFYGVSDIGFYFATDQNGCDTFSDEGFAKMWETSPLRYVNNVATPTLIIHSSEDYRCPLEQGYQWLTALKDRDVPCEMFVFYGETHELSRSGKPKGRLERLNRITQWFEKYLMPEINDPQELPLSLPAGLIKRRLMIEKGRNQCLSLPEGIQAKLLLGSKAEESFGNDSLHSSGLSEADKVAKLYEVNKVENCDDCSADPAKNEAAKCASDTASE